MKEALQDGPLLRQFALPDAFEDLMLAEIGILGFRNLLGKHELAVAISIRVNAVLSEKRLSTKRGRDMHDGQGLRQHDGGQMPVWGRSFCLRWSGHHKMGWTINDFQ